MTAAEVVGAMSYAEYLAFEREAETKHEYVNGQVYAMAGGPTEHARLALRLGAQLLGDGWQYQAAGPGEQLCLDDAGLILDIDAVYRSGLSA